MTLDEFRERVNQVRKEFLRDLEAAYRCELEAINGGKK